MSSIKSFPGIASAIIIRDIYHELCRPSEQTSRFCTIPTLTSSRCSCHPSRNKVPGMASSKIHSKRIPDIASFIMIRVSGILRHPSRSEFPSFPGIVSSLTYRVFQLFCPLSKWVYICVLFSEDQSFPSFWSPTTIREFSDTALSVIYSEFIT
jgi:hypothetical protein